MKEAIRWQDHRSAPIPPHYPKLTHLPLVLLVTILPPLIVARHGVGEPHPLVDRRHRRRRRPQPLRLGAPRRHLLPQPLPRRALPLPVLWS